MSKKVIPFLVLCTLLSGCKEEKTYTNSDYAAGFDTVFAYTETTDEDTFTEHFKETRDMFSSFNNQFDIYNEYSDVNSLMTVNKMAGIEPVKVEQSTIDMLKTAKEFYEFTDGKFDVTMGTVLKIWHQYREDGITKNENGEYGDLPTLQELEAVREDSGWDSIEIDEKNSTVYITDENISLDVGGIAKGYSAEMIGEAMEEKGVKSAIINAGRNIRTIGSKKDGSDWRVGIANPVDTSDSDGILTVSYSGAGSFVTSGDYERFYIARDGESYCHIIDPVTLYPATYYHSVTIITKNSSAADALSTALFVMSIEDGKALLQKYVDTYGESCDAIWIMDVDKKQSDHGKEYKNCYVEWTDGIEDSIQWN